MNALFLEVDIYIDLSELPRYLDNIEGVSGESADRFYDNHVNLALVAEIQCIGDLIGAVGKVGIADREHISVALVDVADKRTEEHSLYGTGILRHLTDGVDYFIH